MAQQKSQAEDLVYQDLVKAGFTAEAEHEFHPDRQWRLDLAFPEIKLAIEIDGSGFHTSDKGKRLDQQKRNAAIEFGWRVLSYPARECCVAKRRARIVEQIGRVICGVTCEVQSSIVLVGD